jgi:hypothetical protein
MAAFGEILETVMMICFGISWPLSVYKSYKSRSTAGKSFVFLFAIWIGYVAGIFGKLMMNNVTPAFYFYILNITIVSIDIALFFRNKKLEKQREIFS